VIAAKDLVARFVDEQVMPLEPKIIERGIAPQTTVWVPGEEPLPRPPKLARRDGKHQPISVKELALDLPASAWRKVTWREGAAAPLSSRFARVHVRVAHRDCRLTETRPEEWLLIDS